PSLLRELVEGGEEEALDAAPLRVGPEGARSAGPTGGGLVGDAVEPWRDLPLANRDLPHLRDAVGHLPHADALRKADPERARARRRTSVECGEGKRAGQEEDGEPPSHAI